MSDKEVIIYSGGMDSYTLLILRARTIGAENVVAVSFDYAQRHKKELEYAKKVCKQEGIQHVILPDMDLSDTSSALTMSADVPHGHYESEKMKVTVVPYRNLLFIVRAAILARVIGAKSIYYGAHSGDHAIYPDCRPDFIISAASTLKLGDYDGVELRAPFMEYTKGDIAKIGKSMALDYSRTWTCYEGGSEPCGKCGSCVEREEALREAGYDTSAVL